MVALHSTDPASVPLSIAARTTGPGATVADVDRALYDDRSLVRVMGMRRTIWVVPAELVPVVAAACGRAIAADERRKLAPRARGRGRRRRRRAVVDRGQRRRARRHRRAGDRRSRRELTADVPALKAKVIARRAGRSGRPRSGVGTRVVLVLGVRGPIVRERPRGSWTSSQYRWSVAPPRASRCPRPRPRPSWPGAGWRRSAPTPSTRRRPASGGRVGRWRRRSGRWPPPATSRRRRRRRRRPSAWAALLPEPRPDDDGVEGARLVPRRPRAAAVRPQRQRRGDGVVGRPDRRRLGAAPDGRGRHPAAGRRRRATAPPPSRPRRPGCRRGSTPPAGVVASLASPTPLAAGAARRDGKGDPEEEITLDARRARR